MDAQKTKKSFFVVFALFMAGSCLAVFANDSENVGGNLFGDFDQDGLSNDEETRYGTDPYKADTDGDGYSDYTEVSSGYDPLKPAPGDKLIDKAVASDSASTKKSAEADVRVENGASGEDVNLTEEAFSRIQTVLNSGEVKSSEDMIGSFQDIIKEMLEQNTGEVKLPDVDVDSIKIKKQDYDKLTEEERKKRLKEDDEEYLTATLYIFTANMPEGTVPNVGSAEEFNVAADAVIQKALGSFASGDYKYIDDLSQSGERILEQMKDVKVPENMLQTHARGTQLALYAAQIKDEVRPDNQDPIKSIMKMSKVQGFLQLLGEYVDQSEKAFEGLNIGDIALPGQ